jgi:hypothetical protein
MLGLVLDCRQRVSPTAISPCYDKRIDKLLLKKHTVVSTIRKFVSNQPVLPEIQIASQALLINGP